MANSVQILQKLARNLQIMGFTIVSQSQTEVVVLNGSNNLQIQYINASFSPAVVGGVDPSVSPYLGIGVGNPGQLALQSVNGTTIPTIIDGAIAAQVLASMASFANDIVIADNSNANPALAVQLARLRGDSDLLNMGQ
jgi:hypothetical protein